MAKKFTLGKKERLKSRKLIEQLFSGGKNFAVFPYRVYYLPVKENATGLLQFGVGVSSRSFKRAVDRNRIKRLTREAWRVQKHVLADVLTQPLAVFVVYTGRELPDLALIGEKTAVILKKLTKITNEDSVAGA